MYVIGHSARVTRETSVGVPCRGRSWSFVPPMV